MTIASGQVVEIELRTEDAERIASRIESESTRHQMMASGLPGVKERFSPNLIEATKAILLLARLYAGGKE
jgi:hypothetical protein